MPAKIKADESKLLNYFLQTNERQYLVYKMLLLQNHGCNPVDYDINDQGVIARKDQIAIQ